MRKIIPIFLAVALLIMSEAALAASLQIRWQDNSDNEEYFRLERSTTGDTVSFSTIANIPAGTTQYLDAGLTVGTLYYYKVAACNGGGCSLWSNTGFAVASGSTQTVPLAPGSSRVDPIP